MELIGHTQDPASEANFVEILRILKSIRGIDVGSTPAFGWSGGNRTLLTVSHNLGVVPRFVICGNADFGDAMGDGRAPWATVAGNYTKTTFDIAFATHENSVIGVFTVAAGTCNWIAIA